MRSWLLDTLVPGEKLVDRGFQGVSGVWNGYIALIGAHEENRRLQAENQKLQMQLQRQDEAIRESARLRDYLNLSESGAGTMVAARVIGRDPSRSFQTVTIDKGQVHGIQLNDSVITPEGVVGRIISVGRSSALVQLITDTQSAVAAVLRESRIQALFKGTGGRDLELDYIDDDSGIRVNDEVLTSGFDQVHPKGLPLGIVKSVNPGGELFKLVLVQPAADLSRLEEVLVITDPAPDYEESPSPATPDTTSPTLPSD
jgi:rod shape-determining protein MreC